MARAKLTTTTFKPLLDKWVALDGAGVVLWADADELLLLRHEGEHWQVTWHQAVEPLSDGGIPWSDACYSAVGRLVHAFTAASPKEEWERFYSVWFGRPAARLDRGFERPEFALI